jgi:hypothetical protein
MAHFHDNALVGASGQGGYQISRSLRFNSADSAYLNRGMSAGSGRKKFTISFWTKISKFGTNRAFVEAYFNSTNFLFFGLDNSDKITNYSIQGGTDYGYVYTPVYRDPSAWYHFMTAWDTDNATATQRIRTYVNGVEITAKAADYGDPPSGYVTDFFNTGFTHSIGRRLDTGVYYDGLMTEFYVIDGQALTPSSFGETDTITGVWKPKKYAGTYGTNGFYLNFSDNSGTTSTTLGKDSSGNSNNWTPNNFSVTAGVGNDSLIDTPTPYADGGNGRGNYATFAPTIVSSQGTATLANGNLDISGSGSSYTGALSSIAVASGKWYWEYTINSVGSASGPGIIATTSLSSAVGGTYGFSAASDAWFRFQTYVATNSSIPVTGLSSLTTSDVAMIALDVDAGKLWFGRNGTWESSGNPATGANATITFTPGGKSFYAFAQGYGSWSGTFNAGQRPFAYTPPSGFLALNTQNLPEPSIKKPGIYFDATTYTGNGANPQNIINSSGFQPDLVWTKSRNNAGDNFLADAVRGAGNILRSNLANAEVVGTGGITAFNSNGFSVNGNQNTNAYTYVGWQWKESATPGFDIVTYTGNGTARTIAHSLGVAPSMMVIKRRDAADNWGVYHTSLGNGNYMYLDGTQGSTSGSMWNNTTPTSSVFSVGTSSVVNANTGTYVAYLWSEVAGFSKFGSYTGNGSSDGPFVFLGFRPRWIVIKRSDTTDNWWVHDAQRSPYNTATDILAPNLSIAEATLGGSAGYNIDFLSNGFKVPTSNVAWNASGGTFIYAAFAETSFKFSLAK